MVRVGLVLCAVTALGISPVAAQDRAADAQAQPPIQARPGGPEGSPRTDQTVDVTKGTRLVLSNNAGEVVVRSWDRDQVRVVATHSDRERIDVQTADMTLRIRARASARPLEPRRLSGHRAALDGRQPVGHVSRSHHRRHDR